MSFQDLSFKSTPNFRWKENVAVNSDCLSASFQFDCYRDKKNDVILITPYFDLKKAADKDYHISLINLKTKEVHKLPDHKQRVSTVRYFQDPKTKKDYFISADREYKIKVWDLGNEPSECKPILQTEIKYEGFIYSCLLMFEGDKMYGVTSSLGANSHTKVFDVKNPGQIVDINESNGLLVYYLDYWFNANSQDENKRHVIIQGAKNKILMSEFPSNSTYYTIDIGQDYPYIQSGLVFKDKNGNDLFAFSATYGLVRIEDLATKTNVKTINLTMGEVHLYSFVKWNEQYLLLNDCQQSRIIVFDMEDDYKIKSKIVCPEMGFDKFMRKVDHPVYGESILSVGIDWTIKLFVNRNYIDP